MSSLKSVKVIDMFNDMVKKTAILIECIKNSKSEILLPEWQSVPIRSTSPIDTLSYIYNDIWYLSDEDGRETRSYQGIVFANKSIILAAKELNKSKEEFHDSIIDYIGINKDQGRAKEIKKAIAKSYKERNKLTGISLSRLNLKACYRKILVIDIEVKKISFCQQNSSLSISKQTKNQAMKQLDILERKGWDVEFQIEKLKAIDSSEILAKVQKQAPIIKANIKISTGESLTRKPSLPIIIHEGSENNINFLEPNLIKSSRSGRSDKKISDIPFLPTIRIHRYIK